METQLKIRILRVISTMNPEHGGPSQGIRNSIPTLTEMGLVNEVLSFDSPNDKFIGNDSFPIHAIGPAIGPYRYCKKLHDWLINNLDRFDVVIIHGLWLYNSYGTYKAWEKFKSLNSKSPKLYIMPHGMLDPYFQRASERKLKAFRNTIMWHLIEKHVINKCDGVLFTCQQELILARETFRDYKPKRELNVKYGILAPPSFEKIDVAKGNVFFKGEAYWLFLSRIHSKKGVNLLIEAYLKLKREGYKLPKLIIAGPGLESDYGQEMQRLANEDVDISFPGMLSGDSKWAAIYGAEVFVLPSHQENFGISIVEAMACGIPVIISDQVNIWSEIKEGHAGLVGKDDLQSTYELLKTWVGFTDSQKKEFNSGAIATYKEYFTVDQAAREMAKTLQLN